MGTAEASRFGRFFLLLSSDHAHILVLTRLKMDIQFRE